MILGIIDSVDSDNGLKVIVDGETSPSTKKYSYLASYVPTIGDRVLIEELSGSYVILGKLTTEVAESGIVRQAQNATNANHASTADNATNATNATTAESCSGNAATATTAASCSGNSATATRADGISSSSTNYTNGRLVNYISREYNATLGKYIVTDVSMYNAQNYVYKNIV